MEQIRKTPSYGEQIADSLRYAIIMGTLKEGEELRQTQLAESLQVSRIPVREALQALERDGLVNVSSTRRVVVAGLTDEDIIDHYSVRALVEGEAAARAAANGAEARSIAEAHRASVEGQQAVPPSDFAVANRDFHEAVWSSSGSAKLSSVADTLWSGIAPHTPHLLPEQVSRSITDHQRVLDAVLAGNGATAREAMSDHIMRSAHDLIAHRRTAAEED